MKLPFQAQRSRAAIQAEAADWLARREEGLPRQTEEAFQRWRSTPEHAAAWERVRAAWLAFDQPDLEQAGKMVLELERRRKRRVRRRRAAVLGLGFAAACILWQIRPPHSSRAGGAVAVLVTRPEHRLLPDGTVVELDQGAEIEVRYAPARREVRLRKGQALFAVAREPGRPFIVSAGSIEVRAVGTAFVVRLESRSIDVLVTEGRVRVEGSSPLADENPAAKAPLYLDAGNRAVLSAPSAAGATPPAVHHLGSAEIAEFLGWRGPRLELSRTPLGEAIAALNRESDAKVTVADPELAAMPMSGVFRADNAEGFVRLLEGGHYGIRVERRQSGEIILHREQ